MNTINTQSGTMICSEHGIAMYRLLALKSALKLECLGMRHSRGSAHAIIKREFGFKGNKQHVLAQLEQYIAGIRGKEVAQ